MTALTKGALPGTAVDPLYPDSDGRPMGDTDHHSLALIWLREALEDFFAAVLDVYVATNIILYYEHGNPKGRRDPDVLVARGVSKHRRRSFRVWEEGTLPCVLVEIASRKTWREDVGAKRALYAQLGVPEYFIFDPEGLYINPPLQGFQTRRGASVPMKRARDGSLTSKQLGLRPSRGGDASADRPADGRAGAHQGRARRRGRPPYRRGRPPRRRGKAAGAPGQA
jgi:Uma2 family endonuclease